MTPKPLTPDKPPQAKRGEPLSLGARIIAACAALAAMTSDGLTPTGATPPPPWTNSTLGDQGGFHRQVGQRW